MELWVGAGAWWTNACWVGGVLASGSVLTQIIHADHQTIMLLKHSLMERRLSLANSTTLYGTSLIQYLIID